MGDFGIRLDQRDEGGSELGVPPGELDSKGWEYSLEVAPVLEVSGAEEGCTQPPVRKRPLRNSLCDGALARPSEPVQPVDLGFVEVAGPEFNFVQDRRARSSKATIPISMPIFSLLGAPYTVEDSGFGCKRLFLRRSSWKRKDAMDSNLDPRGRGHFVCAAR